MPLVLIAAVVVVDLLTPPQIFLTPLLVGAPAVAVSYAGPRFTAAIGALAVAAQVVLSFAHGGLGVANNEAQVGSLVLVSACLVLYSSIRERHAREMVQVRSVSEAAQQVVLRPLPKRSGPLLLSSLYLAAEAEARIGGDLYAAARTAAGTRLLVGDVRGKGLDAISDAALLMGAFRAAAHRHTDLPQLAHYLDRCISPEPADGGPDPDLEEGFTTAVVLDIPDNGTQTWMIDCGHPPPLLLRGPEVITLSTPQPAPPLGLGELGGGSYLPGSFDFLPGDMLLLYTDGVIEARNTSGDFYPLTERITAWAGRPPHALLESLHRDLLAHAGGHLGDDAAMVAVQRLPQAAPPRGCDPAVDRAVRPDEC
ncbi:PP2C family protein-serine/threonine phosphatase [Peterkaempfera bronchialis]|uniref:PP2C family protein-serine/threonine phosphatase n=1 Tax=Peterkaempfera bronchialis TaxID=2126346 RepID=UPI00389B3675